MSDSDERAMFDALVGEPDPDFAEELLDRLLYEIAESPASTHTDDEAVGGDLLADSYREQPTEMELVMLKPNPQPNRPTRTWVASIAAALILVIGLAVALTRSDDTPVVTDQPSPGVSQYEEAAETGDPRAVLGIFAESYRVGDVETALEYADSEIVIVPNVAGMEESPLRNRVSNFDELSGRIAFEGELYQRAEPGASECFGPNENDFVWCTFTESDDSPLAAIGVTEVTWSARIEEGRIVTLHTPGVLQDDMDLQKIEVIFEGPLRDYVAFEDPEGSATECRVGESDGQCGSFLAGYVDDYLAWLDELG